MRTQGDDMTKDEALRLALEALKKSVKFVSGSHDPVGSELDDINEAITAIKAALEAKDELVATIDSIEQEIYENTRQFVSLDVMEWMLKRYYTTPSQQEAKDEPVAWMRTSGTGSPVVTEALLVEMPEMRWNFQQPLYTTPPQRKPLTDEEVLRLLSKIDECAVRLPRGLREFARAIEAAHGITGENK
jgi:hypothetical protein